MADEEKIEQSEEQLPTQNETIKKAEDLIPNVENDKSFSTADAEIKKLEKEKEEYLSGWKRAKADLLNYKKETEEKMKSFALFANSSLVFDLLAIVDSFDLALNNLTEKDTETPLGKGYYLIQTQLLDILRKYGLEVIEIKNKSSIFNPNLHEAIATKICDNKDCDNKDEGIILEVLSKGYLLHGKLLRPAKVKTITHN